MEREIINSLVLDLRRINIAEEDLAIALNVSVGAIVEWLYNFQLTDFRYWEIRCYISSISATYDDYGNIWSDAKKGYIVSGSRFACYDRYGFHFTEDESKATEFTDLVSIMRAENILKSKRRFREEPIKRIYIEKSKTPTFRKEKTK